MPKEMTAKQNAKLNMYRTVEKHIGDNVSVVPENTAFQNAVSKFNANNAAIADVARQRSASLVGIAADKSNSRKSLCELAASIAGVIFAYASANNNETLKQEMNLPVSVLARTRDEALAPRCQMIHDRAQINQAALNDYGIKPAQITQLQTAINNYSAETIKPRQAVTTRKTATANLAALFKENDDILKNQIDKLIELYRANYPDFVNTYFESRNIIDPPTRMKKTEDKTDKNNP